MWWFTTLEWYMLGTSFELQRCEYDWVIQHKLRMTASSLKFWSEIVTPSRRYSGWSKFSVMLFQILRWWSCNLWFWWFVVNVLNIYGGNCHDSTDILIQRTSIKIRIHITWNVRVYACVFKLQSFVSGGDDMLI